MSADLTPGSRAPRSTSPATRRDKLARALERGADELIVDLEDAVAPAAKDDGPRGRSGPGCTTCRCSRRRGLGAGQPRRAARGRRPGGRRAPGADRRHGREDRDAPTSSSSSTGCSRRWAPRPRVVPLLESAAAVLRAVEIAQAPRVQRLQIGEADLRADVGVTPGPDERELLLRPLARRPRLGGRRHRAADRAGVDELPRPRRVPRVDRGAGPARVRRPRLHPPRPGRGRQRGLHARPPSEVERARRCWPGSRTARRRRRRRRRRPVRRRGRRPPGPPRARPRPLSRASDSEAMTSRAPCDGSCWRLTQLPRNPSRECWRSYILSLRPRPHRRWSADPRRKHAVPIHSRRELPAIASCAVARRGRSERARSRWRSGAGSRAPSRTSR